MQPQLFLLRKVSPWGDYGDVLVSGFVARSQPSGDLLLDRGGPFVPPISFPYGAGFGECLVVTDSFRRDLEDAPFGSLTFRPVIKNRIVQLPFDWRRWDRNAEKPRVRPPGGEPEGYISELPHSPAVAGQIPELWELLPPVLPCAIEQEEPADPRLSPRHFFVSSGAEYRGLFRDREKWFNVLVDESTRRWFEQRVPDWVSFETLARRASDRSS